MKSPLRITAAQLYLLPVTTRVPLKFGPETLTSVTCARVRLQLTDDAGNHADGWGETPLSVQWVWPSSLSSQARNEALQSFCHRLASAWLAFGGEGHAMEIGHAFIEETLPALLTEFNILLGAKGVAESMPWLAALVCNSAFDLALHDAYAKLRGRPIYETYNSGFLRFDLDHYLERAQHSTVSFRGRYPADFLLPVPLQRLPAWHLVGGADLLEAHELTGTEPQDGHPVLLTDWIKRDGLKCLKIKLRGNDPDWDFERLVKVGTLSIANGVENLSADFNCTVTGVEYVNDILDHLRADRSRIFERLLYIEQPFPYDLEAHRLDVRSVAARKPLFLDESAHDWRLIRLGRELGWTGVALKTCKTQTGAILSACWAKAHGVSLMVQDLTNPMLAQIPHVSLAAHVGTLMGVETNAMQFYPGASTPEARVHPGLYQRRNGEVDLTSIRGAGFGYRSDEIGRELPAPAVDLAAT
jgi:L-alanine-DL-glutamate epimerase-like enolase superfamily enzyme